MGVATNLFWMLDRSARASYGDEAALVFGDRSLSFRDLRDRALLFAAGLKAQGLGPGSRVAVLMGNRLEWPEVLFGLAAAGAICVPVNVLLTGRELDHVLSDSGAACMVMDELALTAAAALSCPPQFVITVGAAQAPAGAREIAYEDLMSSGTASSASMIEQPGLNDPFIYYYSSGTTGLPKAAVHTHNNVLWNSIVQIDDLDLDRSVTYLVVPSFSWAAGFHNLVLALLWKGGRSVIMPTGGLTFDRIAEAVEKHSVTHTMLVPTLIRQLAGDEAALARLRGTKLRWIITGAEPVPTHLVAKLGAALPGCSVCQAYGLSEFPSICTVLAPEEALTRNGSAGRPLSHSRIAVRREDDVIADVGRGELLVRSLANMIGYHNAPEKTAEALRDGWVNTGDLADIDEDGYVFIIGRTKDMVISGGLNVYPKEIEEVLNGQPGVFEVAVVGVPDKKYGERVVAIIVEDGQTAVDAAALGQTCREQLAGYKSPRDFLVRRDLLPRNASGKILKRELRPWAEEQLRLIATLSD
jgi:fatty-acyl-CoA synthase